MAQVILVGVNLCSAHLMRELQVRSRRYFKPFSRSRSRVLTHIQAFESLSGSRSCLVRHTNSSSNNNSTTRRNIAEPDRVLVATSTACTQDTQARLRAVLSATFHKMSNNCAIVDKLNTLRFSPQFTRDVSHCHNMSKLTWIFQKHDPTNCDGREVLFRRCSTFHGFSDGDVVAPRSSNSCTQKHATNANSSSHDATSVAQLSGEKCLLL